MQLALLVLAEMWEILAHQTINYTMQPSPTVVSTQPSLSKMTNHTNAVPVTAEAGQLTRTPCNAAQQVVKLYKT